MARKPAVCARGLDSRFLLAALARMTTLDTQIRRNAFARLRLTHENALFRLRFHLIRRRICGDVLHELAASLRPFALDYAHPARRHVARLQADDAAIAHLDLRPKPVGAEHAARGIESHRRGDGAFEFRSGASDDPAAHFLRPGHAPD